MQLLRAIAQGSRLAFDRKTHRQGRLSYNRLSYVYHAARVLENSQAKQVSADIIEHLTQARQGLQLLWGRYEWGRLSQAEVTLSQVDERMRNRLVETLGEERFTQLSLLPLSSFIPEDQASVVAALGWRVLNEQFRYILLSVISEQWIDYLTRVEALRVSIGLEAYAQRDPLVMYKSRASEMFQSLLADIRYAVISRMFTFQMRRTASTTVQHDDSAAQDAPEEQAAPVENAPVHKDKKRRRH
jgi:preprotein translocase subunit SecA